MKINKNFNIFIISLLIALIMESYIVLIENPFLYHLEGYQTFFNNFLTCFSLEKFIIFFLIIFAIIILCKSRLHLIYKYRFLIAGIILVICVLFEIHGSSLGCLKLTDPSHRALIGISRPIRSDEYNIFTPFAFSQYYNNFSYFSSIIRAVPTDMVLIYGQPVWDIVMVLRPFQIGYLFLNPAKGLSFYWISRLLALFLVSFEMGMLFTRKNKTLSLVYAILLTFSPWVQWWFSINALVEMLIFAQLALLLIDYFLNTKEVYKRLIVAIILAICIGGFVIALYPAWEVPLAYIFLFLAIWVLYKNKSKINKKDLLYVVLTLAIVAIFVIHIFTKSYDTIQILANTAYPASRAYYGGMTTLDSLGLYVQSLSFPIAKDSIDTCALALCIGFFPLNLILLAIVQFKQKQKDLFLYGLLVLYLVFYLYFFIRLPAIVGDVTFLKKTFNQRLLQVISFIDLLILIRSLAIIKPIKKVNKKVLLIICFVVAIAIFLIKPFDMRLLPLIAILFGFGFYYIIQSCIDKENQKKFLIVVLFISLFAGAFVNPIETGTDYYFNSQPINAVEEIVKNDPNAVWLVVGEIKIDEIVGVGAHTFNSVHTYPDLESFSKLDSKNQSYDVYNRYAHIRVNLQNNTTTIMPSTYQAAIYLNLDVNDLEKVNISYIISTIDLESLSNEKVSFIKIYDDGTNKIYHVQYKSE